MKCPKCRIENMKQETYEGIEVDRCPSCKGLFLDKGELPQMMQKQMGNTADTLGFSATSDQMDELAALCSKCNRQMIAVNGPGDIRVDFCQGCGGLFLDQGELATIQLYAPPPA